MDRNNNNKFNKVKVKLLTNPWLLALRSRQKSRIKKNQNDNQTTNTTTTTTTTTTAVSSTLIELQHKQKQKQTSIQIRPNSVNSKSSTGNICDLENWGLPTSIVAHYASKGITQLFDWQCKCLSPQIIDGKNLVYSAPTSAGKSLVSDILLYKHLLEKRHKAMIVLPFVSLVQERMIFLKRVLSSVGIRVDAFAGNTNPRGGYDRVHVAVCTIEKANNMINRLIEEKDLRNLGYVVVDELHMIGDSSRGYLLELLLSKILYLNRKHKTNIQIVSMSATVSNLNTMAKWLDAELFISTFRPIPLIERLSIKNVIYNTPTMSVYKRLDHSLDAFGLSGNDASVIYLSIETLISGHGTLIFCATKSMCEKLCRSIAKYIFEIGSDKTLTVMNNRKLEFRDKIIRALNMQRLDNVLKDIEKSSMSIDSSLLKSIRFGVAYHHAGLALDERNFVENAFRTGLIKIVCATSTLAAGVNLPARLVIINSPFDYSGAVLDAVMYRQMIGRAGRQGVDTEGESILNCAEKDSSIGRQLTVSGLLPIKSKLINLSTKTTTTVTKLVEHNISEQKRRTSLLLAAAADVSVCSLKTPPSSSLLTFIKKSITFQRCLLEAVATELASTYDELSDYVSCSFFVCSSSSSSSSSSLPMLSSSTLDNIDVHLLTHDVLRSVIECLIESKLIYVQSDVFNVANDSGSGGDGGGGGGDSDLAKNCANKICATQFGKAVVSSGMLPHDGLYVMKELSRAKQNVCLSNDLHLLYEITPSNCYGDTAAINQSIDWTKYLELWSKLDSDARHIGELIGIRESFIVQMINNKVFANDANNSEQLKIHNRFYTALALYDLIQEKSLENVSSKFGFTKGSLQTTAQSASSFAGMLTVFCSRLGWHNLELLIEQFQSRLYFGIQTELIDLMRISCLNIRIARHFYNNKYRTVSSVARVQCSNEIEPILLDAVPFNKDNDEPNELSTLLWSQNISNVKHMNVKEFANIIIVEAREIIEKDLGVKFEKWTAIKKKKSGNLS